MGDLRWAWDLYDANRLALQWDYPAVVQRLALSAGDETRLARALELTYAADVEALDALFGRTLSTLEARGLGTDSLVAFTADHGETLFRDNALFHWTHGLQLAPEVLSVPFILRAPELLWTPGSRRAPVPEVQAVTRSIDVFPTLAGLCGLDLDGRGVSGEDLSAVLRGEAPPELLAFSHTTSIGPLHEAEFRGWGVAGRYFGSTDGELIWVRVRQGDRVWKWINVGEERFEFRSFDLATDPEERRDLFDPGDERDARMAERLRTYKDELLRGFQAQAAATGSGSESIPADALERLQGLGYVDGDDPDAGH